MKYIYIFFILLFLQSSYVQSSTLPIVEVVSNNGIKAWLVEDYNLPLISMKFSFKGGVETDAFKKQGTASLAVSLLSHGAGSYNEKSFQDKLAKNSIDMSFYASRDYVGGEIKTLKRTKSTAFELLRLALTKPRFDKDVFDRIKKQQITSVRFQLSSPSWQGRYALYKKIYGNHPYSYRSLGSFKTIDFIGQNDVKDFVKNHFAKDNLEIAVVGAISSKELKIQLDRIFGDLPNKHSFNDVAVFKWDQSPASILVKRKSAQTNILFAKEMIKRSNKDWYAAKIANYILGGGGFESRLMQEVRAHKGLTYGISTSIVSMDKASIFVGGFSTDNKKVEKALPIFHNVCKDFYEKGITDQEIKSAKDYLIGSVALSLTSTDSIADVLLYMQNQKLGINYLDNIEKYFKSVKRKDVMKIIKKWFNLDNVYFSYVGEPEKISTDYIEKPVTE